MQAKYTLGLLKDAQGSVYVKGAGDMCVRNWPGNDPLSNKIDFSLTTVETAQRDTPKIISFDTEAGLAYFGKWAQL